MKIKRFIIWLITLVLLVTLMACNLPAGQTAVGTPDVNATVAARVAINLAIQTMVAQTLAANGQAVPPAGNPPVGNPSAAVPSKTNTVESPPQMTSTPTLTPTITLTSTPEWVTLVLTNDTYCRVGGPYSSFKVITTVKAGQLVEVLSRNPENDSYFVQNPYDPNTKCWLYGKYATLSGDTGSLPVSTMQPTPTPTPTPTPNITFSVSYTGLDTCLPFYGVNVYIKNTGGGIWQSLRVTGSDSVTGVTTNFSNNSFIEYPGCVAGLSQSDLAPGEGSNIELAHINYNPTGNLFNVTITLCTLDGGAGICKSRDLSFTP